MSPAAALALTVHSLVIVVFAFACPFLTNGLREDERAPVPIWAVAVALVMFGVGTYSLRNGGPNILQTLTPLWLTAAMLLGILFKWFGEILAQKKMSIHEKALVSALLAAPLTVAIAPNVFGGNATVRLALLWFLTGYCWQAVFHDIGRIFRKEPIVIRRREPPYPEVRSQRAAPKADSLRKP